MPSDQTDLSAIPAILARLAAERRKSMLMIGLAVLAVFGLLALVLPLTNLPGDRRWVYYPVTLIFTGVFVGGLVSRSYRGQVAREVMPLLARAVGLGHGWGRPPHKEWAAAGLVPRGGPAPKENDQIHGTLGNLRFSSWDLRVESGGKNSSTLFEGMVVTMEPVGHERLFLKQDLPGAAGWMQDRFGKAPEGLVNHSIVSHRGKSYELWLAPGAAPGFDVAMGLAAVGAALPGDAGLLSVLQERGRAHVAVTLKGGLVDLGGLFTGAEALRARIDAGLGRLVLPAKVAAAWSEAQRQG